MNPSQKCIINCNSEEAVLREKKLQLSFVSGSPDWWEELCIQVGDMDYGPSFGQLHGVLDWEHQRMASCDFVLCQTKDPPISSI